MMRRIFCLCALFLTLCVPALAKVKFKNVALHDPAVIKAEEEYYFYGSHMQGAKSTNLYEFKNFSNLDKCNLQPNYAKEFSEALTYAKASTFWAPDVIRLGDGRYYMYYCCCEGSSPLSALGVAVGDTPEGPFRNIQVLLYSGGPGYDATHYPNAIDPCVFFDASGERLYMVYGSYSGGIFLLELDPETGLLLPDQGYGTHLLGGNHSCIEAPYIVYNPETEYYYLFLSFGGLAANDGYNIRVCRARSPEGPYEDAAGNSMLDCKCKPGHYFNNDEIAPYGTKLMGSYLFRPLPGENSDKENAVRSPGHNSVFYDEELGKWFLFHHARFAKTGEQYRLQARELYFNQDGWPVISPVRYTPETETDIEMTGSFKVLSHERDVNPVEHVSEEVQFNADGTFSGARNGTYEWSGNSLTLNMDGLTWRGHVGVGYDDEQDADTTCFTLLSEDGEALWGILATIQSADLGE